VQRIGALEFTHQRGPNKLKLELQLEFHGGGGVEAAQRAGNKPSHVRGRKEFVSTSVLTPALSSRRGRIIRRFSENSRDWICRTVIRRTGNMRTLFLLPEGEGQVGRAKHHFHSTYPAPEQAKA